MERMCQLIVIEDDRVSCVVLCPCSKIHIFCEQSVWKISRKHAPTPTYDFHAHTHTLKQAPNAQAQLKSSIMSANTQIIWKPSLHTHRTKPPRGMNITHRPRTEDHGKYRPQVHKGLLSTSSHPQLSTWQSRGSAHTHTAHHRTHTQHTRHTDTHKSFRCACPIMAMTTCMTVCMARGCFFFPCRVLLFFLSMNL